MGNNIKKKLLHELLLLGEKNDFMSNEFVSYLLVWKEFDFIFFQVFWRMSTWRALRFLQMKPRWLNLQ